MSAHPDAYAWPTTTPCPGRLGNLHCTRDTGHAYGHTYQAAEAPDRHTYTEAPQED